MFRMMVLLLKSSTMRAAPYVWEGWGMARTEVVCGVTIPAGSPTVGLWIEVLTADGRWKPVSCPSDAPEEYVYTEHELDRVMRCYAHLWAMVGTRTTSAASFRVTARGLFSGRELGYYTWQWNPFFGGYEPTSDPWLLWNERAAEVCRGRVGYSLSGFSRLALGVCPRAYAPAA